MGFRDREVKLLKREPRVSNTQLSPSRDGWYSLFVTIVFILTVPEFGEG
jgi:hypothetical protein